MFLTARGAFGSTGLSMLMIDLHKIAAHRTAKKHIGMIMISRFQTKISICHVIILAISGVQWSPWM